VSGGWLCPASVAGTPSADRSRPADRTAHHRCWQLDHYAAGGSGSGALDTDSQGQLSIDPVLVAAPALAAGTVLTLRLLPLLARIADRASARSRGLPTALVGWQLARRPQQSSGPILVLALAAAIGTLALGQSSSWHRSQLDQAAFDTGADVRIADTTSTSFGQGGSYSALPGVTAAVPVARQSLPLAGGRTAELLALDTRTEAGLLDWRPDLRGESVSRLLGGLADPPAPVAEQGIPLPGRPTTVSVVADAALTGQPGAAAQMTLPYDELTLTVMDRYGMSYSLTPLVLPTDGATHTLSVDLTATAGGGVPAYPLTLTSVTVATPVSTAAAVRQDLTVHAVLAGGAPVALPRGFAWSGAFAPGPAIQGDDTSPTATTEPPDVYDAGTLDSYGGDDAAPLTASLASGTVGSYNPYDYSAPSGTLTFSPQRTGAAPGPLPAVVDQQYLDATDAHVGSVVPLFNNSGGVSIRITAVVAAIPGTGSAAEQGANGSTLVRGSGYAGTTPATDGGAVLVDLAARDRPAYGHDAVIACDRLVRIFSSEGVEVQALQGLDLTVRQGELMALVGASGSGKSTLLQILAGLDVPTAGKATVSGCDLLGMSPKERLRYRREVVGFVWQQTARNLLPFLTARQNVALPMQLGGGGGRKQRRLRAERSAALLDLLGIGYALDRRPAQLSGGEQQRVAIAVALANEPSVLLADEPTGELDSETSTQIFEAFRTVNRELGSTVVIVTHDLMVAGEVSRTVAVRDGRTSTEVLRRMATDEDGRETLEAREYAMLDRTGRVQLPRQFIEALGMEHRVGVSLEQDHVGLWPDREPEQQQEPGGQA
jgi:ABC-type lipoprotein export system ATPase subunit